MSLDPAPPVPSAPIGLREGSRLDGVEYTRLTAHADERGSFTELFADDWGLGIEPAQWSVVQSERGVLRGMHHHRRHDELFSVVVGHAHVGLHDLRPGSPTEGLTTLYTLSAEDPGVLVFAPGIVHGWLFPEPSVHVQATSESYADYGADDNEGCHWADPALGIDWPVRPTNVSPRAEGFGTLADLRKTLG